MSHDALETIVPGEVSAPILKLDAPISFWGGVDMESGRIIDQSHPQRGETIGGFCLVVPSIRGSGGTPGNLAMTIKLGLGPAGIVVGYPDVNVMAGVVVAQHLYGKTCPLYIGKEDQMAQFETGKTARIDTTGRYAVSIAKEEGKS